MGTLTGPEWFKWVNNYVEKWVLHHGIEITQYYHCVRFMEFVREHQGDLQKVALAKRNLENMDDAFDIILSD